MISVQTTLKNRLLLSAAPLAALASLAAPALAQDQAAPAAAPAASDATDTSQDIVVTGTLFRRTDSETPSPVSVLTSATIEQRGLTTISDVVNSVAASNGGGIPQNFTGAFASGASAISLRALTTNSTLTLFDGLRAAYYPLADDGQRSIVDLNTIPSSTVDRVEVLRDGASATYGADAIAGVVNVITKKEITGISGRVEGGVSGRGDVGNQRVSLTLGHGHLKTDGFNFYISGEYQHSDALYNKDRGFPYNTNNLSSIDAGNGFTGRNGNTFVTPPSSSASTGTTVAIVRPTTSYVPGVLTSGAAGATGQFQVLGAGGCGAQGLITHTNAAGTYCEQDLINTYGLLQPEQTRFGGTAHATVNFGDAQAYLSATFYQSRVFIDGTPQSIRSNGNPVETRGIALPALLSNGQLNPNNPFAASGRAALIYYRFGDIPSSLTNTSRSYRIAGGIDGKFGDGFSYTAGATYMRTDLVQKRKGFLNIDGLTKAINDGSYNFVNPSLNTQGVRDSIAPTFDSNYNSELWQVQASVAKDLFDLPGGPLQVGVGGSARYEAVYDPNPVALVKAITVNPFSAIGNRYVESGFFEINAPVLDSLEVNASGRYDHYSIGLNHFSPKIGAKFTPIKSLSFRGTYSEGFRAPSIPETSGSVIGFTQYTPGGSITDPVAKAALLARYGNDSYITTQYGLGNNSTGNPAIKPETSRSFTAGVVFAPKSWLSMTVDYYNIKKKNLILSAGGNPASIADNYLLTGAIPAGVTITPNATDTANPALRPTPLSVNFLYSNGNTLKTSGIDAQIQIVYPISDTVKFTSVLEGTEILNYDIDDGTGTGIQHFVGTLASYATTSASGTPRWRANWQNMIEFGPYALSTTTYFTSGYKGYADDNTGPGSTCAQAIETSVKYSPDFSTATTGSALQCTVKHFLTVDLNASVHVTDGFTFYVNVQNLTDASAPFDPNTYGGNNYNPAWSSSGLIGRTFRAGATFKF